MRGEDHMNDRRNYDGLEQLFDRRQVFHLIRDGSACHAREISRRTALPLNTVYGHISRLESIGLIEATGERREGCAVYRLTPAAAAITAFGHIAEHFGHK